MEIYPKMSKSSVIIARCLLAAVLLKCSGKAIQFDCNFEMSSPSSLGDRYACIANVINSGSPTLESVIGVHQAGKSNDDVEWLRIAHQNLTSVPGGIVEFFKNLDTLWIEASSLMSISANDLRPFPRLIHLDLLANKLTSIDGDLFKYTPNLLWVYFDSNQIQHIGHDLVTSLSDLTVLFFQNNLCINQNALNREEVLGLAPKLSVLCKNCLHDDEICSLKTQVYRQNGKIEVLSDEIEQLYQEKAVIENRLWEVEMKLSEIGSVLSSNKGFGSESESEWETIDY